jgi:ribosome recycling factor
VDFHFFYYFCSEYLDYLTNTIFMDESIKPLIQLAKDNMDKSLHHLESELSKIRAGKAHPSMLDSVKVDYYGMLVPISQAGSVSVLDARTLSIQPFERKMIVHIERAIQEANIGLNPQNNGEVIRLPIPALNEQRRKELVKQTKNEGEDAKIAIRNIRQDTNAKLRKLQGASEDAVKTAEKKTQDLTDEHIAKIEKLLKLKEEEIMQL